MSSHRIGFGTDLHPLVVGESLILGGELIEMEMGTEGHSDGDVLVHALVDALIGAAGWKDIGEHFGSDNKRWEDTSSLVFLRRIADRLARNNLSLVNADLTVHLEEVRLGPYRSAMRTNCEEPFESEGSINLSFTTAEGLGPVGRGEAVRAEGICLLERIS